MRPTTKPTSAESRLETLVRDGFTWLEECILSIIRFALFILDLPRRVLPTLLHVAAFTTVLPPLLAISIAAGLFVVNLIPEGWEANLWMQYGEQATPFARTVLPPLIPGQPYDVFLALDVPVTQDNLALGNFMTKLILTDAKNVTVASANRPALVLENRSSWIPFFTTASHIQTINVPLVESWSPALQPGVLTSTGVAIARGTTQKGFHAFVAVGRPDSWKSLGNGQGKELSIARAVLHGRVQLSGFRGFFARHTLLLFVLTTTTFFVASTLTALALYVIFAPSLSEEIGDGSNVATLLHEQGTQTTPRMRVAAVKEEDTDPASASETDYSWTSGGAGEY